MCHPPGPPLCCVCFNVCAAPQPPFGCSVYGMPGLRRVILRFISALVQFLGPHEARPQPPQRVGSPAGAQGTHNNRPKKYAQGKPTFWRLIIAIAVHFRKLAIAVAIASQLRSQLGLRLL